MGVALLLSALIAQLAFSLRRETQTWDEACHTFAGYSYWTRSDFGMNPEHPPPSDYAFYRYVKRPSLVRFLLAGMAPGCILATKHSGVIVFPSLALLALAEIIRGPRAETKTSPTPDRRDRRIQQSLQFAAALVVMALIAVCILWSFYGFRFAARTHGRPMNPRLAEYASQVTSPVEARAILTLVAGTFFRTPTCMAWLTSAWLPTAVPAIFLARAIPAGNGFTFLRRFSSRRPCRYSSCCCWFRSSSSLNGTIGRESCCSSPFRRSCTLQLP